MAFNAYIRIGGAEGESESNCCPNWIDVESFDFGTLQSLTSGAQHVASGRADIKPFKFTHAIDKAVPKLMELCANSTNIPVIDFQVYRQIGGGAKVLLYLKMEHSLIIDTYVEGVIQAESGLATDGLRIAPSQADIYHTVQIMPRKATWTVSQYKSDGTAAGSVEASWDKVKHGKG